MDSLDWKNKGEFITVFDRNIFVIDTGIISNEVDKSKPN